VGRVTWRVTWFRSRATSRRRLGGHLATVRPVQRAAETADHSSTGATPALLAAAPALGALGALAPTLAAPVRRWRRDLANLEALGSTSRQRRSTVCWQASLAVGTGVQDEVPAGVAFG